ASYYPGSGNDDDFQSEPYLVLTTPASLMYKYVFEDPLDATKVGTATGEDELEIKFLGKQLKITSIADGTMTVEASNDYYMEEGDKVTVDGHEVELKKVGSTAVLVTVDGQTLSVTNGATETFDQADDFEVKLDSLFYIENALDNSATLQLGNSISDVVNDGDSLELFGEPSDEDEADWVWDISVTANNVTYIGAVANIERTKLDISGADERAAVPMGDAIEFPNNYAAIEFTGWEDARQDKYEDLDLSFKSVKLSGTYYDVAEFSTSASSDSFYVGGSTKAEKFYVAYNTSAPGNYTIWYDDGTDKIQSSSTYVNLKLDTELTTITPGTDYTSWVIGIDSGAENFSIDVQNDGTGFTRIGSTNDEAVSGDVLLGATDISTNDDDFRTTYGVIVKDMESQMDKDEFSISIPEERQIPLMTVRSKGTVVSAAGGSSYTVNPIALGLGILDTDAPALGSKPMIVVGGPYANTVAAELLGNPTPEQIGETFTDGKALIRWYDDKQAMLVAGWSAQDTLGASYVVARADQYDLSGDEVEVVVTSLDNIKVNSVN
ncbi:MAG: hypothetical protein KC535_05830, partial [Nanoarchaeota archaeon]|nr:hypothetical protein [Nanoarchaeota archaeon]